MGEVWRVQDHYDVWAGEDYDGSPAYTVNDSMWRGTIEFPADCDYTDEEIISALADCGYIEPPNSVDEYQVDTLEDGHIIVDGPDKRGFHMPYFTLVRENNGPSFMQLASVYHGTHSDNEEEE